MKKEELQKALEDIFNNYNAYYYKNEYSEVKTHQKQFDLLSQLKGDKVERAIRWIKHCYDFHYKNYSVDDKYSAFAYLQKCIDEITEGE